MTAARHSFDHVDCCYHIYFVFFYFLLPSSWTHTHTAIIIVCVKSIEHLIFHITLQNSNEISARTCKCNSQKWPILKRQTVLLIGKAFNWCRKKNYSIIFSWFPLAPYCDVKKNPRTLFCLMHKNNAPTCICLYDNKPNKYCQFQSMHHHHFAHLNR